MCFTPQNPWLNDESDIVNDPGVWTNIRTADLTEEQLAQIDLEKLTDPTEPIYSVWRAKLDRIADALAELRDAGVVVLFRPIQEANGFWFWYGTLSHPDDPWPYVQLYRDMYDYFTNEKGLNNLLWVYAGNNNYEWFETYPGIENQLWIYPGSDYVDIIGSTSYNDNAEVFDYPELIGTGKPICMSEFGADLNSPTGQFDNRKYIESLSANFPGVAFWVSRNDWPNGDGSETYMSIMNNLNAGPLLNDSRVITRERIGWADFMD